MPPPALVAEAVAPLGAAVLSGVEEEASVEKMLQRLGLGSVGEVQEKNGLEGVADERTWKLLAEQYEVKRRKEEDKIQKREEAKLKAKQENERKLQLQQQESAKALDVILEKALTDIGASASTPSTTAAVTAPPLSGEMQQTASPKYSSMSMLSVTTASQPQQPLSPTAGPSAPHATSTTPPSARDFLANSDHQLL